MPAGAPRKSVDFYHNFLISPACACTHNGTDSLGDPALLADNASHIVGSNMQMINDNAVCIGLVNVNADCRSILNKTVCNT